MIRWPTVKRDHKGNVVVADVEYINGKPVVPIAEQKPLEMRRRKTAKGRIRPHRDK